MGVRGLHHIGINVPDLVAAERFYMAAFGFEKILEESWEGSETADQVLGLRETSAHGVNLWAGNVVIELFEFKAPEGRAQDADHSVSDHGISHLCLQVDDIAKDVARMGTMGMTFHSEPVGDDSGWFVYGRDPWGNVIELLQPANDTVPNVNGWRYRRLPDRTYN
jgi:catechol 2,3-dioxygenase-like lactoylglutathione lyase family enzyme